MSSTTAWLGGYGFSFTLRRTGTSSCGAPYGSKPSSSSRIGSPEKSAIGAVLRGRPREAHGDGGGMARQVLGVCEVYDVLGDIGQRLAGVVHDVHGLEEAAHRQAGRVAGAAGGRQHVVRPGAI